MGNKYLGDDFSLDMMDTVANFTLFRARRVSPSDIPSDVISVVVNDNTAKIISGMLGFDVPTNRTSITLSKDDILFVAQYNGPRLKSGATELPKGASISFMEITFKPEGCGTCHGVDCNMCGMYTWSHGS